MDIFARAPTLPDLLRIYAAEQPTAKALWFEGRETDYATLDAQANRCAHALIAAGMAPGARIAVLTKNSDAFAVLWFGAMKARVCTVPVNTRLAVPEIAAIIGNSGATMLFYGADFVPVLPAIGERLVQLLGLSRLQVPYWVGQTLACARRSS